MKDNKRAPRGYKEARLHEGKQKKREKPVQRIPTDSFPVMAHVQDVTANGHTPERFYRTMPPRAGFFNDFAVHFDNLQSSGPVFLTVYINDELAFEVPAEQGLNKLPDIGFRAFDRVEFGVSTVRQVRVEDELEPTGDQWVSVLHAYVAGVYFTRAVARNVEIPALPDKGKGPKQS